MMMIYGKDILVSFIVWQQMHALVISRTGHRVALPASHGPGTLVPALHQQSLGAVLRAGLEALLGHASHVSTLASSVCGFEKKSEPHGMQSFPLGSAL
eukprot:560608-Rhodomonas_salina.13